ncbi:hypothetical protein EGW08_012753 [Elysia chlorotica]|uniref:Uncharacterized protein n=1 Tax=Elysia chlorotica TaxID=188477 RepID=A0A3S1HHK2_ELYCH|nr:hypothetical protein EGW08_012753 [Elysia chlorotica]
MQAGPDAGHNKDISLASDWPAPNARLEPSGPGIGRATVVNPELNPLVYLMSWSSDYSFLFGLTNQSSLADWIGRSTVVNPELNPLSHLMFWSSDYSLLFGLTNPSHGPVNTSRLEQTIKGFPETWSNHQTDAALTGFPGLAKCRYIPKAMVSGLEQTAVRRVKYPKSEAGKYKTRWVRMREKYGKTPRLLIQSLAPAAPVRQEDTETEDREDRLVLQTRPNKQNPSLVEFE